jgi:hypothetical protein
MRRRFDVQALPSNFVKILQATGGYAVHQRENDRHSISAASQFQIYASWNERLINWHEILKI